MPKWLRSRLALRTSYAPFAAYVECETTVSDADEILQDEEDAEMRDLATEEKVAGEAELETLEQDIKIPPRTQRPT